MGYRYDGELEQPMARLQIKELGSKTLPDFVRIMEKHVRANRSHAALVYDGVDIVGWCQFGPPAELPARMGGFRKLGEAAGRGPSIS
jgi:hypothetical protein